MLQLFLVPAAGDAIEITTDRAAVGRRETCEVHVADRSASRNHARLERRDDGWYVIDEGSANGTFVDGTQVTEAKLAAGAEVQFGDVGYRVELREDQAVVETVQMAVPRGLRFDEPGRRPKAAPAPLPAESPTIRARPAAGSAMTQEAAREQLGLPPGASVADGRRRYEQIFNDYQVRVTNAPTAALRRMYQRNLNELKQAFETLFPGQALP